MIGIQRQCQETIADRDDFIDRSTKTVRPLDSLGLPLEILRREETEHLLTGKLIKSARIWWAYFLEKEPNGTLENEKRFAGILVLRTDGRYHRTMGAIAKKGT